MKNRLALLCLSMSLVAALSNAGCDSKKPSAAKPDTTKTAGTTEKADEAEWCAEHGVPESICTKCNPKLIADFKQKGDWCKEHSVPESQCIQCDPTLKEKFEAMAPKPGK
ncbi:MAG: RND transporter [Phycisphaerae bacterium]|nr:RND transporter [Phycisphaerae bacterium]